MFSIPNAANWSKEPAPAGFLDLTRIIAEAPSEAHFYCCGPRPMLDAFETATLDRPPGDPSYDLMVFPSFRESFWSMTVEAGAEYGVRIVG